MLLTGWLEAFKKHRRVDTFHIEPVSNPSDRVIVDVLERKGKYTLRTVRHMRGEYTDADTVGVIRQYLAIEKYVEALNKGLTKENTFLKFMENDVDYSDDMW